MKINAPINRLIGEDAQLMLILSRCTHHRFPLLPQLTLGFVAAAVFAGPLAGEEPKQQEQTQSVQPADDQLAQDTQDARVKRSFWKKEEGVWKKKLVWKEDWVKVWKIEKREEWKKEWKVMSVPAWKVVEVPIWKEIKVPEWKINKVPAWIEVDVPIWKEEKVADWKKVTKPAWKEIKVPLWKEEQVEDWKQIWVPEWVKVSERRASAV